MTFSFFGPPSTNDIRVGYISTDRGYVTGVDICEANSYAKKNPGTIFIFRNGNNDYQYLTINQVNKLTPSDLSNTTGKCGGLKAQKECGPPRIQIFGGGGVGAAGNPVVGIDGSILAVDLIRSGHGYQYPPLATAIDDCQYGSGIILRTVLGEEAGTEEVFDREEDFENYEICDDSTIGFGTKYGSNGEDLGPWNPDSYSAVSEDPIRREIENYLEDLKNLKNPFWSTRNRQPNSITALGRRYPNSYNVTFPKWNEFMNRYAISPVSPSNVRGSDESGKIFSFEWVEEFPFDGQYTFRGLCDNTAQLYVNDEKVFDLGGFNDAVRPTQKYFKSGVYKIKIDLLNVPIVEKLAPKPQQPSNFVEVDFKVSGDGRNTSALNFSFSSVDGSHSFVIRSVSKSGQNKTEKIKVKPNTKYKVIATSTKGPVEQGTLSGSKKNKEGGLGSSNSIFADHIGSDNDNDDIQITCSSGTFTATEKSTVPNSGRSTFKLAYQVGSEGQQTSSAAPAEVISPKSWNENPMGISVSIDAPKPPPLKETPPIQEGRCPNNPIWSTRFPSSSENWYPVRHPAWADFFNRYAISPIIPSSLPGTDGAGITYKNSWEVEIPYRGFYEFRAQRDNTARIYLDGNLVFDVTTSGDVLWVGNGLINKVKGKKVLIEKGRHTISVELENTPQETSSVITKKIFSTKDWQAPLPAQQQQEQPPGGRFIKEGSGYYLLAGGNDQVEISFVFDWDDNPFIAGTAATKITIPTESGGPIVLSRPSGSSKGSESGTGTFKANRKYGPIQIEGAAAGSPSPTIVNTGPGPDQKDQRINFFDADGNDVNAKLTTKNAKQLSGARTSTPTPQQPTSKGGVTYSGPPLFNYKEKRWSSFMNEYGISPKVFNSISEKELVNIGKWDLVWENVDFPEDGSYDIQFQGDNVAILKIGGREIQTTTNFVGESQVFRVNITKGKYKVEVQLENIRTPRVEDKKDKSLEFSSNPYGISLYITKNITKNSTDKTSWFTNPVGIGAILVPPPCPKKTGGKGIVDKIIVQDPGNGYLPPANVTEGPGYPVTLQLTEVIVDNPGINYNCGVDQIRITPSNGAVLDYTCDSFGKIKEVKVLNPGTGFVEYPIIEMVSPTEPTGVNASFIPVFEVVRDPIETPPEKIIQVTDLVGLKQTGYVDGRPYYGAVYYEDGVKFAGYFKTVGTPVQVYDTLQESIVGRVTTRPSAIQRSGTDVTSNDSRLNIPGTPENLI